MVYKSVTKTQVMASLHIATLREFNVVAQILERIPASTKISYGTVAGTSQNAMVLRVLDERAKSLGGRMVEASGEVLQTAATSVKGLVRGCKSGSRKDVFAESRSTYRIAT